MINRTLTPALTPAITALALGLGPAQAAQPEPATEVLAMERAAGVDASVLRLTSTSWRGTAWRHWMQVFVPETPAHTDHALLLVDGGHSAEPLPALDAGRAPMLATLARQLGMTVAVVRQVPNQPLQGGRFEDELIAHSFEQYLRTGDEAWPVLGAMVDSATAAMDAVAAHAREHHGLDVRRFVLAGASKRAWAAWLTAAGDERVAGLISIVFDMLDFPRQLELQATSYGDALSPRLAPYARRAFARHIATPRGQALLEQVDPWRQRDELDMPKLLLLGTNDPFWPVDAAGVYVGELAGPTHLHYQPGLGYALSPAQLPTAVAFVRAVVEGQPLPQIDSRRQGAALEVTSTRRPRDARLWQARSSTPDFTDATWQPTPLEIDADGVVTATPTRPGRGYKAYYVELGFEDYALTTAMRVIPRRSPDVNAN